LRAWLAVFQLGAKSTLWWEDIKTVQNVDEQGVTWDTFQRYLKDKYLNGGFYDEKVKEFHDLQLEQ